MGYKIAEHGDSDYRLERPDGTETGDTWSSDPHPDKEAEIYELILKDQGLGNPQSKGIGVLLADGYQLVER